MLLNKLQTNYNDDKNNTNFMCWTINHQIKGKTIKIQRRNNGNIFSQRFKYFSKSMWKYNYTVNI